MCDTHQLRTVALAAALSIAAAAPAVLAADAKDSQSPRDQYDEYVRDTTVPQVPAATLLGVDRSKIVEVSNIATFASSLSAARQASADGTPFGIDVAPFVSLGGKAAMANPNRYVSDPWVRLLTRTRLSYATAQNGNAAMTAWGIHTRPIDLRDPFVDPGLRTCFSEFTGKVQTLPKVLPKVPDLGGLSITDALSTLKNAAAAGKDNIYFKTVSGEIDAAIKDGMPPVSMATILAWVERLNKAAEASAVSVAAGREAAQTEYGACAKTAVNSLPNRTYWAIGYSRGTARAVDGDKPLDQRPGAAIWTTLVYGFEGFGNVVKDSKDWRDSGYGASDQAKAGTDSTALPALAGKARLTLHLSRTLNASKRVADQDQSTAGTLVGVGFDYGLMDTPHRAAAQWTRLRAGEGATRSTERRAVLGLDFRLQQGLWFGLSWARVDSSVAGKQNETLAAIKWAFSETSWLAP